MDQQKLKTLLRYEPDTGELFWLPKPRDAFSSERLWNSWKSRFLEKRAGTKGSDGYRYLQIEKKSYKEHRLVWLYVYGYLPPLIDHIDRDRSNNRISNLREATLAENGINSVKQRGVFSRGIEPVNRRWRARIKINRKHVHIGYYQTREEALAARKAFELKIFGEFSPQ